MVVRPTAVLIEREHLLLVREPFLDRAWSLPGGKLEDGETLKQCVMREVREETGLRVAVDELLYVADRITDHQHIVHITFLVSRTDPELGDGNEDGTDEGSRQTRMVPVQDLQAYGFSSRFQDLIVAGFPNRGSYQGPVRRIGL